MKMLAKFVHGSHLYGLNTEDSDLDFKGVYMPDLSDMLLGNITDCVNMSTNKTNNKNSKDDVDYEVYSLHKFVHLLSKGEMVCFDMLFAPEDCVEYYDRLGRVTTKRDNLIENPIWELRHCWERLFVHRDMKAYLGYCRRQAAKYGIKGSRLDSLLSIQKAIPVYKEGERLVDYIDVLPQNEFLVIGCEHYEVLGKKHQFTTTMFEFMSRIQNEIDKYGNRAKLAQGNEGIDWKAVSHAFRAGYQIKSMLENAHMDVVLPDNIRQIILDIKLGKKDWESYVKPGLEVLMDDVEDLAKKNPCKLQDKPDKELIEDTLLCMIEYYYDLY